VYVCMCVCVCECLRVVVLLASVVDIFDALAIVDVVDVFAVDVVGAG
jgi:hypothetical protein